MRYESVVLELPGPDASPEVRKFVHTLNSALERRPAPGETWNYPQELHTLERRIRTLFRLEQMFGEQCGRELMSWIDQIVIAEIVMRDVIAGTESTEEDAAEIRTRTAEMQEGLCSDVSAAVLDWYIDAIGMDEALGLGKRLV